MFVRTQGQQGKPCLENNSYAKNRQQYIDTLKLNIKLEGCSRYNNSERVPER